MEHRDVPVAAEILNTYRSISNYSSRKICPQKLSLGLCRIIEDDFRIGLAVEDKDGVVRGGFFGGLVPHEFFEGHDAFEQGFALDPIMREHTRPVVKALIEAFELWAKEKGAIEVAYWISSGIPGRALQEIFDETGYERIGYCARKEL
jgi:GNAT superfamily N-acetyltransferase